MVVYFILFQIRDKANNIREICDEFGLRFNHYKEIITDNSYVNILICQIILSIIPLIICYH